MIRPLNVRPLHVEASDPPSSVAVTAESDPPLTAVRTLMSSANGQAFVGRVLPTLNAVPEVWAWIVARGIAVAARTTVAALAVGVATPNMTTAIEFWMSTR